MATLAVRPTFHLRNTAPRRKHEHRRPRVRRSTRSMFIRAISIAAGAAVLCGFSVFAPMIGDPARRLFALDSASSMPPSDDAFSGKLRLAQAFEWTPTMLGPEISSYMVDALEEDAAFVTMPVLVVHALPFFAGEGVGEP